MAEPTTPEMPKMTLSQVAPLVLLLGTNKYDLAEMGYTRECEAGYAVAQLCCFVALYIVYVKISQMADDGKIVKVPEQKQMGQVVKPAMQQTTKEYDEAKFKEAAQQALIQNIVLAGIYYKWHYVRTPLVLISSLAHDACTFVP